MSPPKRQKTSDIWNFFTPDVDHYAKCNICKKIISYKPTNSNMRKHIKTNHPPVANLTSQTNYSSNKTVDANGHNSAINEPSIPSTSTSNDNLITCVDVEVQARQPSISKPKQQKISSFIPRKLGVSANKIITDKLLKMFTQDYQPFSMVQDRGFNDFVKTLNPSYDIPNRYTISKSLIPARYEEVLLKCRSLLANARKGCITTDCWTSINTESFIGVTAHFIDEHFKIKSILLACQLLSDRHTSLNLAETLREIAIDWNIQNKIILAVSDNAANIKSAITKELGWKFFGCFAHSLNLVVTDGLNVNSEIISLISKIKVIVGHFKRSALSNEKLRALQKKSGKEPLKLIQDVATRWNSTFYMLKRFVELEEYIRSTIAVIDKDLPILTQEEWKICHQLCKVLKPFEEVTKTISGEKYATCSLVIPLSNGLKAVCQNFINRELNENVKVVVEKLNSSLIERFKNVEHSNTLALCTFLDPRFKMIPFSEEFLKVNLKKRVIGMVTSILLGRQSAKETATTAEKETELNVNISESDSDEELSIWGAFQKTVFSNAQPKSTANSQAIVEVQRYLECDLVPRSKNPCEWWSENRYYYPLLSEIFQDTFCAIATSVPCERLFSKAGQIITERRNRINSNKASMLIFLNCNEDL
ncbi:E3 SUMO-protein ligase ZBED1-like [Anthonomus grandis grandis]|uniref:E3 SUMO-protein ligase ZBED1-like n=1 Tax=Anthonomus grandis grandis TaxID=2921223 RepID=UPI0021660159|nr:E3 SUMO-protein ligase ZBED1-like [Anthonomus grandis grandis]